MINDLSYLSVIELNYTLFVAFGIWFTMVCFINMVGTAVQIIFVEDEDPRTGG